MPASGYSTSVPSMFTNSHKLACPGASCVSVLALHDVLVLLRISPNKNQSFCQFCHTHVDIHEDSHTREYVVPARGIQYVEVSTAEV